MAVISAPVASAPVGYGAATNALSRRFDILGQKAEQQARAAGEGQQDLLKRRFASLGGLQSGSFVKQEQMVGDKINQNITAARDTVEAARTGEMQRLAELEAAQSYGTSERIGAQEFQSGETLKGREWQSEENALGRALTASESQKMREMTISEADLDRIMAREQNALGRELTASESKLMRESAASESKLQRDMIVAEAKLGRELTASESKLMRESAAAEKALDRTQERVLQDDAQSWQKVMARWEYDKVTKPKLDQAWAALGLEREAQDANTKLQISEAIQKKLPGYSWDDLKKYGVVIPEGETPAAAAAAAEELVKINAQNTIGNRQRNMGVRPQSRLSGQGMQYFSDLTNPPKWVNAGSTDYTELMKARGFAA